MSFLENATVELIGKALNASTMRQEALANNIANWRSEGYVPLSVNFESQLTALQAQVVDGPIPANQLSSQLDAVQPYVEMDKSVIGYAADDPIALDHQMTEMAKNVLQYQALLSGMSSRSSMLRLAIHGQR